MLIDRLLARGRTPIVVVSGLPRSGTSLMMQMLKAGGIELVTDGERGADDDNPRGYHEFERVKQLPADNRWLPDARGKAIKLISMLLFELPSTESYSVIFMERNLDEILASQARMLERRNEASHTENIELTKHFERHLERVQQWLSRHRNVKTLRVSYAETIKSPKRIASLVANFLGTDLDEAAMAATVDPLLYRNRSL
jgi:hypothetical protein